MGLWHACTLPFELWRGYNNGKGSSATRQNKEIQQAHKLLRAWKADQAKNAKRKR